MKSSVTQREQMVETQLRRRGIRNERVLAAMGEVPREQFVPEELEEYAYHDGPLPIGDAGWELRRALSEPRLERAIGVIYRPETELQSHYFQAVLPHQFDEWIWADETHAVTPLDAEDVANVPDTYPFGV